MENKRGTITLNCGINVLRWMRTKTTESLRIDLSDLYSGHGEQNKMSLMADLFKELSEKGYKGNGISINFGLYDSVDGLYLEVNRKIK